MCTLPNVQMLTSVDRYAFALVADLVEVKKMRVEMLFVPDDESS